MRWNELDKESCPVARGLSVVGDRWNLLILRDCFLGVRRFDDFQASLGVTRHVLADRLRKLEAAGVLRRELYQERPARHEYRLTKKGRALYPVLLSLIVWSDKHQPGAGPSPYQLLDRDSGAPIEPVLVDGVTGRRIKATRVTARRVDAPPPGPPDSGPPATAG